MPYEWTTAAPGTMSTEQPSALLEAWPHQSLTASGFTWFIGLTAALLTLPLMVLLGTTLVWIFMLFFVATLAAIWHAIMHNRADLSILEELSLWPDRLNLTQSRPRSPVLEWEAQPYWVEVRLRHDGPVENYLTLSGGGREVELGAFLSPEERETLHGELTEKLSALRNVAAP